MEHCYIAPDYASEARLFQVKCMAFFHAFPFQSLTLTYANLWRQKGAKEAEDRTRCWQLPWIPPPTEEPPSEEELARKAAIKEKQGQRLREMAEAKRSSRINELENELNGLEFLLRQLEQVEENDIPSFLSATGYVSKQEIESALLKVTQSLRRTKGEPKGDQAEAEEKTDPASTEKFPLINIPDNMLTPEQVYFYTKWLVIGLIRLKFPLVVLLRYTNNLVFLSGDRQRLVSE